MGRRTERIGILDTFGLRPLGKAVKEGVKAAFGEGDIPPTQVDLTSLKILKPQISIPTWLGVKKGGRMAPVYNLYNREIAPRDAAYSVKVTYARDYRGGQLTYDSHLGTDFALPVGTRIVTCAPGKVVRVINQFDHGGLKIFIDHGSGLITTYGHLSRSLVREGETVSRGQVVGLSGAAGIEMLLFFPWVSPHLHLNVVLNSIPVDPFADKGETSLWKNGNDPVPHTGPADSGFQTTVWNEKLVDDAIADCSSSAERDYLRSIADLEMRAMETINYRMFYNTLFSEFPPMYEKEYARRPVLDLPLSAEDYDGITFR